MDCDYHGGKFIDEYKDYDKAQLEPILPPEEQFARMATAFYMLGQKIQNAIIPTIEKLLGTLMPLVKSVSEALKAYPNKRVVYLALHGKRRVVRRKNINRIKKWIEREGKK